MCERLNCPRAPLYGKDGIPMCCELHNCYGYKYLGKRKCDCGSKCVVQAGYIYGIPIYCYNCFQKLDKYNKRIIIKANADRCVHPGHMCTMKTSYGPTGNPIYCKFHNKGYEFTPKRRCRTPGCKNKILYGSVNYNPEYCRKCANPRLVAASAYKCIECNSVAKYGNPENMEPTHCISHRQPHHIVYVKNQCIVNMSCTNVVKFGNPLGEPVYCMLHRHGKLVNLKVEKCSAIECEQLALYGGYNDAQKYCKEHAKNIHFPIKPIICSNIDCTERATYKLDNIIPTVCYYHSLNK